MCRYFVNFGPTDVAVFKISSSIISENSARSFSLRPTGDPWREETGLFLRCRLAGRVLEKKIQWPFIKRKGRVAVTSLIEQLILTFLHNTSANSSWSYKSGKLKFPTHPIYFSFYPAKQHGENFSNISISQSVHSFIF